MLPHRTPDDFENSLTRRPVKRMPAGWRAEILAAARGAEPALRARRTASLDFFPALNERLAALFWPHPRAWAGLAALWVMIAALHWAISDRSGALPVEAVRPSPGLAAELRQQHQFYAELVGLNDTSEADRPRVLSPKPRSERLEVLAV